MKKIMGFSFAIMFALGLTIVTDASADRDGPTIFKEVCSMCHAYDKVKIGPDWKDMAKRGVTKEWAKKWVRDPQTLWTANEGYTKTLRETFKTGKKDKSTMATTCPKLKTLTDTEVGTIVDWALDTWKGEKV